MSSEHKSTLRPKRIQEVEIEFKPKKGQAEIIKWLDHSAIKVMVVNVFRQYGKSFVARYMALKWMSIPDRTVGYFSPTNRLGKEVYRKFLQFLPKQLIVSANGTDLTIELINKSRIMFFSIEAIQSVRGFTLDYIIYDEVAHCPDYTSDGQHIYYNIISPMLDVKGKKQLFISTPNGTGGFFYELVQRAKNVGFPYKYIEIPIDGDETKTKEEIEEKKQYYPELRWRQEYMCEFLDDAASYFKNFSHLFTETDFDFNDKLFYGVDLSGSGEDETIVTFVNTKKQVIQYKIDGSLDEKYTKIASILNSHSDHICYGYMEKNGVGSPMINEIEKMLNPNIRRKFEPFVTTNNSKQDYVDLLAYDIESENIHFQKGDTDLKEQLKSFSYKKLPSGRIKYEAAYGHDDRVISLALANLCLKHKEKVGDKAYMGIFKR